MTLNMQNPLLQPFETPHQTPPFDKLELAHYLPAFESAIQKGRNELQFIIDCTQAPDFENTIEALENSGKQLSIISEIFFNLNHADTSEEMQKIAREVSPLLTEYSNDIWLNETLFGRVKQVHDVREYLDLTDDQRKLLDDTYKSFVRRGALLNNLDKEKYREITNKLTELSLQFGENVLADTNNYSLHITNEADLDGLPPVIIEAAAERAKQFNMEGWVFTLHLPSYMPFMKYSKNRSLRKKLYLAYSTRSNQNNQHDNKAVVADIVRYRLEKANLLGFKSHADYVLEERMALTIDRVNTFLNQLLEAALPHAKNDVREVEELAHQLGLEEPIERWDFAFYSEILKANKFSVDDEAVKPYFSLDRVEEHVFLLANQLFGLTFKQSNEIPVYHTHVKAFEVFDADGQFLSVLYLDYFPRASKQNGAWMTAFREQHFDGNVNISPVISLVMNFTPPTNSTPSLLTFNDVHTYLHEFGHALHGMLSRVKYQSQSGTNVYRDFVELPSQWFENWATNKEWLQQVACHYQTNQPIPNDLIDKLIESELFQSGYATVRQLSFGLLDMAFHSMSSLDITNPIEIERQAVAVTELFPMVENSCICTAFSHIFNGGYAAGYYGYKWAEVLDADAFELFKQNGIYNRETASQFRKHILEKGGSAHPMDLFVAFRGQEPTVDALLKRSGLTKK
jgi:peptidyl-dipeptidase Dcp